MNVRTIQWPPWGGNAKYRVSIRSSMTDGYLGVIDNLREPCCDIPARWGVLPREAVVRIEAAPIQEDGNIADQWIVWLPWFQLLPPESTKYSIPNPLGDYPFPVRLRIRAVGEDLVLQDVVLLSKDFPIPEELLTRDRLRYKFFQFDHTHGKWVDVQGVKDYQLLDVSQKSEADTCLHVAPVCSVLEFKPAYADEQMMPVLEFSVDACPICGDALQDVDSGLCCTSRKADEITPAPDAAMPWHPRAPCSGARVA